MPKPGCVCPHGWVHSYGVLYGVKMMGGVVRVVDLPECPIHGSGKSVAKRA